MTVWQNRFWLAGLSAFALSACESGGSLEPMSMEEAPMRVEARSKSVPMADANDDGSARAGADYADTDEPNRQAGRCHGRRH